MLEKVNNPNCPHCRIGLKLDDTYDFGYCDTEVALYQVGHCVKCKRDFQWVTRGYIRNWANTDLEED